MMQRQIVPRSQIPLEQRLEMRFEETMLELQTQGVTEALAQITECLHVHNKRLRARELAITIVGVGAIWLRLDIFGWFGACLCIILMLAFCSVTVRRWINPSRKKLLNAALALLDDLTCNDVQALLTLLQALEQEKGNGELQKKRIHEIALSLLARYLPRMTQSELEMLSLANRQYLLRELKRLVPLSKSELETELTIQFFLVLASTGQLGAESPAQHYLTSPDERLREAAREYLHAMRRG
jgi:hypothetical protein